MTLGLARPLRRAFTLVELLVVLAIIAVLVGISIAVGTTVLATGKRGVTEQTLKVLDSALTAYIEGTGGNPPATVDDPRFPVGGPSERRVIPVADARNMAGATGEIINSVGLFLLQCREVPAADRLVQGIDRKFVREFSPDGITNDPAKQPQVLTVFDGWGNPIRYVHPAFKGAINAQTRGSGNPNQPVDVSAILGAPKPGRTYGIDEIRRSADAAAGLKDADAGVPSTDRPYFYSAGADGDPTTVDDNVYLTQPLFKR